MPDSPTACQSSEGGAPRMTAPGQVLRRLFISVGEALRPHRWAVLFLAVLTELVVLASLGLAHGEDAALAVAISFMVLAAVAAGTLAGPSVGAAAALVGGAIFYATVAHFGTDQSFLATAASTAIWMLAGLLSGIIAEALREQVIKREEASVALTQAQAVRQTAEHLLEATAAFHRGESPRQVANDICRAALSAFECVSAALTLVEEASLRTVATAPPAPLGTGRRVSLDDHPILARLIALERPTFYAEAPSTEALAAAPRRASRRCSPRAPSRMCRCAPAGSRWPCSRLRGIRGRSGLTTRVSPSCSASPTRPPSPRSTRGARKLTPRRRSCMRRWKRASCQSCPSPTALSRSSPPTAPGRTASCWAATSTTSCRCPMGALPSSSVMWLATARARQRWAPDCAPAGRRSR